MGQHLDTNQNGYERINHGINHLAVGTEHMEPLIDLLGYDVSSYILTALVADLAAVGSRLQVFATQYKEQLECISIDQSNNHTE